MRTHDPRVLTKRHARIGTNHIAYLDEGTGPPVLLLHGCPFSSFVWRKVIAELRGRFRCLAPDLLGFGDTETPRDADWRLPAQLDAVLGLLDRLGLQRVTVIGIMPGTGHLLMEERLGQFTAVLTEFLIAHARDVYGEVRSAMDMVDSEDVMIGDALDRPTPCSSPIPTRCSASNTSGPHYRYLYC